MRRPLMESCLYDDLGSHLGKPTACVSASRAAYMEVYDRIGPVFNWSFWSFDRERDEAQRVAAIWLFAPCHCHPERALLGGISGRGDAHDYRPEIPRSKLLSG